MSSIVLQPGVKDMLLADCKDFLCSEEWYDSNLIKFLLPSELTNHFAMLLLGMLNEVSYHALTFIPLFTLWLGIPFRRGYLLHGVPGR